MAYTRLSMFEREEISRALSEDVMVTWTMLGNRFGRHRSTIEREVTRNGGRYSYRACEAHSRASRLSPSRPIKLATDEELATKIRDHLLAGYSPAGTSHLVGGVCTETIYQGIYRGHLDVVARQVLRTRRHRRRRREARQEMAHCKVLGSFRSIHERPVVADDRVEFGHWEGDLIIGQRNASALITLNERVSRSQVVLDLPHGYKAHQVRERLDRWIATKPHEELMSITWDRGREMTDWKILTMSWDLDIFFADAHSPWQRGANEHGNRQLRYWFPKGTNLKIHSQTHLDHVCQIINTQPRRILNWQTPNQVYDRHTAH